MPQRGDPKFVRLPERLLTGCLGDVEGSGWFIGGRDVQPFPDDDDPVAQNFVRTHFRAGNLEEASQNEHKTVNEASDTMRKMHRAQLDEHEDHDRLGLQEAKLQNLARRTTNRLDQMRRSRDDDDADPLEEEQEDRGEVGGTNTATRQQTAGKSRQQTRKPDDE